MKTIAVDERKIYQNKSKILIGGILLFTLLFLFLLWFWTKKHDDYIIKQLTPSLFFNESYL